MILRRYVYKSWLLQTLLILNLMCTGICTYSTTPSIITGVFCIQYCRHQLCSFSCSVYLCDFVHSNIGYSFDLKKSRVMEYMYWLELILLVNRSGSESLWFRYAMLPVIGFFYSFTTSHHLDVVDTQFFQCLYEPNDGIG